MIVVSDTSVLNALVKTDLVFVLPELFGEVTIPQAVHQELKADASLADWLLSQPGWLRIKSVQNQSAVSALGGFVDIGEAEAIVLAEELNAARLLIDDLAGRKAAESRGIAIVGTGGVLLLAKQHSLIPSVRDALDTLQNRVSFRLSESIRAILLSQADEM